MIGLWNQEIHGKLMIGLWNHEIHGKLMIGLWNHEIHGSWWLAFQTMRYTEADDWPFKPWDTREADDWHLKPWDTRKLMIGLWNHEIREKLMIGLWSAFRSLFSYCVHTGPDLRSFAAFKYLISGKAWPSDIGGLWTVFSWMWSERSGKNLKLHLSLKATLIFLIKKSSDIIWTFLTIDLCLNNRLVKTLGVEKRLGRSLDGAESRGGNQVTVSGPVPPPCGAEGGETAPGQEHFLQKHLIHKEHFRGWGAPSEPWALWSVPRSPVGHVSHQDHTPSLTGTRAAHQQAHQPLGASSHLYQPPGTGPRGGWPSVGVSVETACMLSHSVLFDSLRPYGL